MSKQVDERVVSMEFDNRQFESNVQTTMSTLDKLKQKLNLKGCAKAAESEFASYKSGFFSFRDSINKAWATWEYDLANRMKNIAKNTLSMFTIDPVKTGFNEYELKMNSVQTIMASTGEDIETVNKHLEELNKYSDQTIYSFSDMTQNIGKFTNAGVKLEDAVKAIKGISNEAALSGANANEAARAMYNFSQALSAGYVKLIDWKSIENANMATVGFKEQLIETAVAVGTLTEVGDGMYKTLSGETLNATKNFNESLQEQWMTSEVLITTLGKYADETTDIGKKATAAATEVKTFTMMMDTLKESAQSGWAKTWELIFGDLIEAKKLWTGLTNFFGGIIDGFSNARNNLLQGALAFTEPWSKIMDKLDKLPGLSEMKKVTKVIDDAAKKLEYFQKVVDKVWKGDYGNVDTDPVGRFKLLEDAGYNAKVVQKLVNISENLEDHKLTIDHVKQAYKECGLEFDDTVEATEYISIALGKLTDEQLKNAGLTKDEIKLYRDLEKEADRLGISMDELIDKMSKKDGRTLLIESVKNAGKGLVAVFKSIKDAWLDIFPPMSAARLYTMIESLNKFSKSLIMGEETADKLKRTFKGLFAIIDIFLTLTGGILRPLFKAISKILGVAGDDILTITANIGDAIVVLRDWIDAHNPLIKIFEVVGEFIVKSIDSIKRWATSLKESKNLPKDLAAGFVNGIKHIYDTVKNAIVNFGEKILSWFRDVLGIHSPSEETKSDGENFVLGFIEGIKSALITVKDFIINTGKTILGWFKDGITGGIVNNLKSIFTAIKDAFTKFTGWLKDHFREVKFNDIIGIALGVGMMFVAKKLLDVLSALTEPISVFASFVDGLQDALVGLKKVFNALSFEIRMRGIKIFCESILILAAALVVLALVPSERLWPAVGALAALIGVVTALAIALGFMTKYSKGDFKSMAISLLGIGGALLTLAGTMALLKYITKDWKPEEMKVAVGILLGFVGVVVILALLATKLNTTSTTLIDATKGSKTVKTERAINQMGRIISKLAWGLLIVAAAAKIAASIQKKDVNKVLGIFTLFGAMVTTIAAIGALSKGSEVKAQSVAKTVRGIGTTLLLMTIAVKILAGMSEDELVKGGIAIAALSAIIVALIAATRLAGKNGNKSAEMIGKVGLALLAMSVVVKILSGMSVAELAKGIGALALLGGIVVGLIAATKLITSEKGVGPAKIKSIGKMLLQISIGFLLIAGSMMLLSLIKWEGLAKAIIAIAAIGGVFAVLIKMANGMKDVKGTIIGLTIGIVAIGALIVALSFIEKDDLAAGTLALSLAIGMFALLLKACKSINTGAKTWWKSLIAIGVMTLVVGALTTVIWLLSKIDPKNSLTAVAALSILIISLSTSLKIMNGKLGRIDPAKMFATLATLAVVVLELGIVLLMLQSLGLDPKLGVGNAIALSLFALALSGVAKVLSKTNPTVATKAVGTVALLGVVALELGVILSLIQHHLKLDPVAGIANATLLTAFAAALAGIVLVLSKINPGNAAKGALITSLLGVIALGLGGVLAICQNVFKLDPAASIGYAVALSLFAEAMAGAVLILSKVNPGKAALGVLVLALLEVAVLGLAGILYLVKDLDPKQSIGMALALSTLLVVLTGICAILGAIGLMKTNLVIGEGALLILVGISFLVVLLMKKLQELDPNKCIPMAITLSGLLLVMSGVCAILGAVGLMGPAAYIGVGALATLIVGIGAVIAAIGALVKKFPELEEFLNVGIPILEKIGTALGKFFGNIVGGFLEGVTSGLPQMGKDLGAFMKGAQPFIDGIKSVDQSAIDGINALTTMVSNLVSSNFVDSLITLFGGESSISKFGSQLKGFAEDMVEFSNVLVQGNFNGDAAVKAANAGKLLAEMADTIPNMGGLIDWFAGKDDLGTFGSKLSSYATAVVKFSQAVSSGKINLEAIQNGKDATDILVGMSESVSGLGGLWEWLTGKENLESFGTKIESFGTAISSYSQSVSANGGINLEAIEKSITATDLLVGLSDRLPEGEGWWKKITGKGKQSFSDFGKEIYNFYKQIKDISTVQLSTVADSIVNVIDTIIYASSRSVSGFTTSITSQATHFYTLGASCVTWFHNGLKSVQIIVKTALSLWIASLVSTIRLYYTSFYSAGSYVASGFVSGVTSEANMTAAYNAGYKLGVKAKQGAEDALDENSPSKEFYKIGAFAGKGFVNAFGDYRSKSYDAGYDMADSARNGLSKAIKKVQATIDSDIDSQPTIRPVLDLSDIESGVGAIGGMFGLRPSVGVLANVGSINSMMNSRQNGGNYDVISAIERLGKQMGGASGDTYNINGVTYDDGSNISDAVKSIVRAARIERRR